MNIFSVLSMGKSRLNETSMSAMLGYLLSPYQDHGLGSKFLVSFLEIANEASHGVYADLVKKIRNHDAKVEIDLEVQYYSGNKRSDVDVQMKIIEAGVEKHRIIIENKIKSGAANPAQLQEYYETVLNSKNNENNDEPFDLSNNELSVIFLTPDTKDKKLIEEFDNLPKDSHKAWLLWSSGDGNNKTVSYLIKDILEKEQRAEISPINEYMRHTLKAFTFFIDQNIAIASGKIRVGEDIGDIRCERWLELENKTYFLILRNSGQIQLLDENGEKLQARPILREYINKHQIPVGNCNNTRCYGKLVLDHLDKK